ncbi:MAG TPA: hypothetical protein VFW44_02965 [Bryobacteraceae bacterium]|nr:hypothetical protein [Bryobacteraceae bacterium]
MKLKLMALLLLGAAAAFPRVVVGFGVNVAPAYGYYYAPPPAYVPAAPAYVAPAPAPNYAWVGGYWYPYGGHYAWRAGYWAPRPYVGARWIAPRYYGGRYYRGYWRR